MGGGSGTKMERGTGKNRRPLPLGLGIHCRRELSGSAALAAAPATSPRATGLPPALSAAPLARSPIHAPRPALMVALLPSLRVCRVSDP